MAYLRTDTLQSCDVLLLRSRGALGSAVAYATEGQFSHAAIYVGEGKLFEAKTTGVGYSHLPWSKVEVHEGKLRLLCDFQPYVEVTVCRMPDDCKPPDFGSTGFHHRLASVLRKFDGLDYSKLARLASLAYFSRTYPRSSTYLMGLLGSVLYRDEMKELPGPFCSELIVDALTEVGFKVLARPTLSRMVSPTDLRDATITRFETVEIHGGYLVEVDPAKLDALEPYREMKGLFAQKMYSHADAKKLKLQTKVIQDFVQRQFTRLGLDLPPQGDGHNTTGYSD